MAGALRLVEGQVPPRLCAEGLRGIRAFGGGEAALSWAAVLAFDTASYLLCGFGEGASPPPSSLSFPEKCRHNIIVLSLRFGGAFERC